MNADAADAIADELYALDRDEFIAARDKHAADARAAGDKDLASRIRALRKPTLAAWLVNRLAREEPDEVATLADLGDELRQAHAQLAGDALRTLSRRRHELVRSLTGRAERLAGGAVSESVSREVSETLDAALTDPGSARAVTEGRLTTALRPGDVFSGDWLAAAPSAPAVPRAPATPKKTAKGTKPAGEAKPAKGRTPSPETAEREAARRAEQERQRQAEARREAENERWRRREELKRAREEAVRARSDRDEARRALRAAEREEAKARKRTESARQAFEAAQSRVADAEAAVDDLNRTR